MGIHIDIDIDSDSKLNIYEERSYPMRSYFQLHLRGGMVMSNVIHATFSSVRYFKIFFSEILQMYTTILNY